MKNVNAIKGWFVLLMESSMNEKDFKLEEMFFESR